MHTTEPASVHFLKMKFINVLFTLVLATIISNKVEALIGGKKATKGQFPFMVSLYDHMKLTHKCGGTIITDHSILTAAHCLADYRSEPDHLIAVFGLVIFEYDNKAPRRNISELIIHPSFRDGSYHNDLAILKTTEPIIYTNFIQPVILPSTDFAEDDVRIIPHTCGFGSKKVSSYIEIEMFRR